MPRSARRSGATRSQFADHAAEPGEVVKLVTTYRVRLEPPGDEFECDEDETVLEAAFENGYNLGHGCREGRCSACKAYVLEGYVYHKPHSSFALSEGEEEEGYALLCRALPESDLDIELLYFDPDNYRLDNPIVEGGGRVVDIESLTHDMYSLALDIEEPVDFTFRPGQYVDLWVPQTDEKRSYSMSNLPDESRLEFMHQAVFRRPLLRLAGRWPAAGRPDPIYWTIRHVLSSRGFR